MVDKKRNFRKEYDNYQGSALQKKRRAMRNKARRQLEREGRVSKGDGKDVDHVRPLSKGGSTSKSNLRVKSKSSNRSYKRNKDGSMK